MRLPDGTVRRTRTLDDRPGLAHLLTCQCYQGQRLLAYDRTKRWLIDAIARAMSACKFALLAWVFMPNHFHLMIRPSEKEYSTAAIRQSIKQPVAQSPIAYLRREAPGHLTRLRVEWTNGVPTLLCPERQSGATLDAVSSGGAV